MDGTPHDDDDDNAVSGGEPDHQHHHQLGSSSNSNTNVYEEAQHAAASTKVDESGGQNSLRSVILSLLEDASHDITDNAAQGEMNPATVPVDAYPNVGVERLNEEQSDDDDIRKE